MRTIDLMVGDWIQKFEVGGHYRKCRITAIIGDTVDCETKDGEVHTLSVSGIEPIPLTAEMLERNGFEFDGDDIYKWGDYQLVIVYKGGFLFGWVFGYRKQLNYVHELQHVLKLCGIDKNIVL